MKALYRVFITYDDDTYAILEGKAAEIFQASFMKTNGGDWVGLAGKNTTRFYNPSHIRTIDFDYTEENADSDLDT